MRSAARELTDKKCAAAKVPPGRTELRLRARQCPGLSLRVRPTGKTWGFSYTADGRRREVALGSYGGGKRELTLLEAKEKAEELRASVRRGGDPLRTKAAEKRDRRAAAAGTVEALCELYDAKRIAHKRPAGQREDRRQIRAHVVPAWGNRPVKEIRRADVVALLELVRETSGGVSANRLQALLSALFGFALERELIGASPAAGLRRLHREVPKSRVLTSDELRDVWQASHGNAIAGSALLLILATGQRGGEVVRLRWRDLARRADGWWWLIPSGFRKNSREHDVPLSALAVELLNRVRPLTGAGEWAFSFDGTQPMNGLVQYAERVRALSGTAGWTPHDLRRTAATLCGEAGVAPHVIEALLGHARGKLEQTYQRAGRRAELRGAVRALEGAIRRALTGVDSELADVLPMKR